MGCGKSKVKKLTEDEVKIIESGHHNGHLDGIPNPTNQELVNSVTASLNSPARASLEDSPNAADFNDPGKRAKLVLLPKYLEGDSKYFFQMFVLCTG